MSYTTIKYLHIGCVMLSYTLFVLRGIWMLQGSPLLQHRYSKTVPHVIDAILLASAITLAYQLSLSPLATPWLLAKIIALLLYIALGTVAIKRGKTLRIRMLAWLAAQLVFFYIVSVALSHNPLPWQAW